VISLITLLQVVYYNLPPDTHLRFRRLLRPDDERYQERQRLLPLSPPLLPNGSEGSGKFGFGVPSTPLTPTLLGGVTLLGIFVGSIAAAIAVWVGKLQWLDWLYFASTVKLVITFVKYVPQIWLNIRLKSSEGFAIGAIILVSQGQSRQNAM
jgi:cystinosin